MGLVVYRRLAATIVADLNADLNVIRWFPRNFGSTFTSAFQSPWPTKLKADFLFAPIGFRRSYGWKHLCTSVCIHGSGLETSKRQKALYSCEFRWFYEGSTQIVDMSSFFPKKDECDFLGSPVTIYKSKKMSQTDCIDLIQGQWQTTKRLSRNVTRGADTSDCGISRRQNHQNVR